MKCQRKFAIESLEIRTVLSVTADVGGPYIINQGEGLQLKANPAIFETDGNDVGNPDGLLNEIRLNLNAFNVLPVGVDSAVSGSLAANLDYSNGVLTGVKYDNDVLTLADSSGSAETGGAPPV